MKKLLFGMTISLLFILSSCNNENSAHTNPFVFQGKELSNEEVQELLNTIDNQKKSTSMNKELDSIFSNPNFRRVHPKKTGNAISIQNASNKLQSYLDWQYRDHSQPYGFNFGLDNIRTMIEAIDVVNARMEAQNDTTDEIIENGQIIKLSKLIGGVRVYLTRSTLNSLEYTDVMLVPVKKSGYNFIDLNDPSGDSNPLTGEKVNSDFITTPDPMYQNVSKPCPTICD